MSILKNFILINVNTDCDRSNGNYEDDNSLISMLINMLIMRFLVMMTIMCFIAWGNGRLPELWLHPNDLRLNERIRSLAPQITRQPSHNSTEKVQSREIPCNPPKIVFQWLPSSSWWLHWLSFPRWSRNPSKMGLSMTSSERIHSSLPRLTHWQLLSKRFTQSDIKSTETANDFQEDNFQDPEQRTMIIFYFFATFWILGRNEKRVFSKPIASHLHFNGTHSVWMIQVSLEIFLDFCFRWDVSLGPFANLSSLWWIMFSSSVGPFFWIS